MWCFDQISQSYKVTKFCIQRKWRHTRKCIKHVTPGFHYIFCYFYWENTSYNKVLWCFWQFLRTCEVAVLKDLIASLRKWRHAREWTNKICYCGLHVNFWNFWKMSFWFTMKKDHFKKKLLLWSRCPLKVSAQTFEIGDFANIFLRIICFWGSLKKFFY